MAITLRTLKWKLTADVKTLPPSCSEIIHLALSQPSHFPACLCNCSDSAVPAAAPPCSNRLLLRNGSGGDSTRSQGSGSGDGRFPPSSPFLRPLAASPAHGREEETSWPCCKSQAWRKGSRERQAPPRPHTVLRQEVSGKGATASVGVPREGTSRPFPSLLAGFPGTEARGKRDWVGMYREGMSQVKRKSQRMERKENATPKTDRNSKRKARVNKRNNQQKVMRENRKRKKPFETDSKFKMQDEKTKRRNKGRSNPVKRCANATPTSVKMPLSQQDITTSQATPRSNRPQALTAGRLDHCRPLTYGETEAQSNPVTPQKPPKQGSSTVSNLPSASLQAAPKRCTQGFIRLHYLLYEGVALRLG